MQTPKQIEEVLNNHHYVERVLTTHAVCVEEENHPKVFPVNFPKIPTAFSAEGPIYTTDIIAKTVPTGYTTSGIAFFQANNEQSANDRVIGFVSRPMFTDPMFLFVLIITPKYLFMCLDF